MLLNITPIGLGDDASPNLWNSRFAAVQTVLNGNVDSDNLKDGAVSRSKIANQAIDSSKIDIQKYIDANGWTVVDFGGSKTYTRVVNVDGTQYDGNGNPGMQGLLIGGNGARRGLATFPPPVGRTVNNIAVVGTYFGIYSGHLVVSGEIRSNDILIAGGNIWPNQLSYKGKVFVQATELV